MKVYLEVDEPLQMKEIESWLMHGPDSVPLVHEEDIVEARTYLKIVWGGLGLILGAFASRLM